MAHLIDTSNNRNNMAYVGATPWHGLGQLLTDGASLDQWRVEAGLDWEAKRAKVQFRDTDLEIYTGESDILYRSDTRAQLGIVSDRYQIVQPSQVLEFFRDVLDTGRMKMETAGSLDGGRKIWALAKTGQSFRLRGQDQIDGYLLLSTSFDGSLATRAQFTSVRVVCNNTLSIATADRSGGVTIPHSSAFDARGTQIKMGILEDAFGQFEAQAGTLADRTVSPREQVELILSVMASDKERENPDLISGKKKNIVAEILALAQGKGRGANFASANGTAWGVVNAVTEWVDHQSGNNANNRFRSAQFGPNAALKSKVFANALALVA